jgi:5-methylcytosine-specific restriction endonuclease McrA
MTAYDHNWQTVRRTILERDRHTCQINGPGCRGKATQVDHIAPLSEGGARLDATNLRAACSTCNAGRQNRRNAQLAAALEHQPANAAPSRVW